MPDPAVITAIRIAVGQLACLSDAKQESVLIAATLVLPEPEALFAQEALVHLRRQRAAQLQLFAAIAESPED